MNVSMLAFIPQGQEWIWIFLAIILLFGARKLPELARAIGKSLGEFRRAKDDLDREIMNASDETSTSKPSGTLAQKSPEPAEKASASEAEKSTDKVDS